MEVMTMSENNENETTQQLPALTVKDRLASIEGTLVTLTTLLSKMDGKLDMLVKMQ
jgi:hypothetical protein